MQTFSQYLQAFGILFFTLMCMPQNVFAKSSQSPNLPLTSKEHKKKFALRGTRGKPGRQGSSGGSTGPIGPTGPTGPAGVDTGGLAGLNGFAFRGNNTFIAPVTAIVDFQTTGLTEGVSYNGTNTFTINTAGQYRIFYTLNFNRLNTFTTADSIQTIIQINGISQPATNVRITPNTAAFSMMYEGVFALNVNDQIRVSLTTTKSIIMIGIFQGSSFIISKLN